MHDMVLVLCGMVIGVLACVGYYKISVRGKRYNRTARNSYLRRVLSQEGLDTVMKDLEAIRDCGGKWTLYDPLTKRVRVSHALQVFDPGIVADVIAAVLRWAEIKNFDGSYMAYAGTASDMAELHPEYARFIARLVARRNPEVSQRLLSQLDTTLVAEKDRKARVSHSQHVDMQSLVKRGARACRKCPRD